MFTQQKDGKDYSAQKGAFSVGNDETGLYNPIFGSIGEPLNMDTMKYSGDSVFGGKAVVIISTNQTTANEVIEQLEKAGFGKDCINVICIPDVYTIGLQRGADTFLMLGRMSQPKDSEAMDSYMSQLKDQMTVYRVTPMQERDADAYANETLTPRGTGIHELAAVPEANRVLDGIRDALIEQYGDEYDYEELKGDIAVPEGLTAYTNDMNAQGDNRDTSYTMTQDFTLDSDEDFIVSYGLNHTATGKAQYSNAVLYARPMLNGAASVYDSMFEGSAAAYLPEGTVGADQYYVYKFARTQLDEYTRVVEYSTGNEKGKYYGVDNGQPVLMAYRAYLDKTGIGPSYYEILYDRTIVFHKKAA